ncbi:MAG: outer membrane lipoprotein carrier protein LolA [Porticoccaceae bacterium]|nr:outer membrane lipoprotein carrier protein LolA [Porticoccaceae bacterium]
MNFRTNLLTFRFSHLIGFMVLAISLSAIPDTRADTSEQGALLDAITAQVEIGESIAGLFEQRKFIAVLPQALLSSGRFHMDKKSGLEWLVIEPLASRMVFDDEGIRQNQNGQEVWQISNDQPGVVIIGQVIQAALSFDWPSLERYFFIDGAIHTRMDEQIDDHSNEQVTENNNANKNKRWTLTLTPRDQVLKEMIERITLEGENQLEKLIMFESANERTELAFTIL